MNRGTILHYEGLPFKDGGLGNKYLIVLNTPQGDEPYLCCKTTSKCKYNLVNPGCYNEKNIYVLNPVPGCFSKKTWIQFNTLDFYPFKSSDFLKLCLQEKK